MSIPTHGMALNITLETYADTMNFGFIGDREAVPHLQRLAVHTGRALTALERGLGLQPGAVDTGATVPPARAHKRGEKPSGPPSSATRAAQAKHAKNPAKSTTKRRTKKAT